MTGYEYFESVLKSKGLKPVDVSRATGIRSGVLSDWKAGRYVPKADKMKLIADYLGCNADLLLGVQTNEQETGYYVDKEAAQYAQAIFEDPDLRALFDAANNISKQDLQLVINMAIRFKRTNPDE